MKLSAMVEIGEIMASLRAAIERMPGVEAKREMLEIAALNLAVYFTPEQWAAMSTEAKPCGKEGCECHKIRNVITAALGALRDLALRSPSIAKSSFNFIPPSPR